MTGSPLGPSPLACRQVQPLLGVLVLGVIDPEERPEVEAHLATCPRCAALVADLAVLPGLMHRVDSGDAMVGLPQPSPELTERVLAAGRASVRADRTRRRRTYGLAAAAVVVLVLIGAGMFAAVRPQHEPPPAASPRTVQATDTTTGVEAAVLLTPKPSGTRLDLTLDGVAPGEHCSLVAVSTDGRREVTSTWEASYEGQATVTGWTSMAEASIASFDVVTDDGRQLVSVDVPPPAG